MSEAGKKWAFVQPCGCVYGFRFDIDGTITTPVQAWAAFYDKQRKLRKQDEQLGNAARLWQDGDSLAWSGCPHKKAETSAAAADELALFADTEVSA